MAAKDSLSSQFFGPGGMGFHISEQKNREGILKKGLVGNVPEPSGFKKYFQSNVPGVFVSDLPMNTAKDIDIYTVDTSNLPHITDDVTPFDRAAGSRFIPGSIPRERVRLLEGEEREKARRAFRSLASDEIVFPERL